MNYSSVDIIYNPNSTGPSDKLAKELKDDLLKLFPKQLIRLRTTKYAGHAEELAYKIAKDSTSPLIVSSSGDGGYNEVVNGAIRAQNEGANPVCAVLAAGNANDHSRTLLSKPLLELIKTNKTQAIDLLKISVDDGNKITERYAHSYIGFGLTPVVATELNKTSLNALKELWIAVRTFYRYRPFKIKHKNKVLTLDSMILTNIGEMAKVLTMSKHAKPDDGLFEVVIFKHGRKARLLRKLATATVKGLEPSREYKEYSFTSLKRMPAQLDGEVLVIEKSSVVKVTSEKKVLRTLIG